MSSGISPPRKNLIRLLEACGPLMAEGLLDGVVLVGSKGWLTEDFDRFMQDYAWRERVLLPGFVAEEDLPSVYAGALVTAQPSLYEGFGLPVLEAMASGCPVVSSNASSLPEVGGDAARYFAPDDVEAMRATLGAVLADEGLRDVMRARGLARAAEFSWERTARETVALYERVSGKALT